MRSADGSSLPLTFCHRKRQSAEAERIRGKDAAMAKQFPPTSRNVSPKPIPLVRVLIVDDHEPWRRRVRWVLSIYDQLQVIGEVADGVRAVDQAILLQPELVLLDIGLPKLNGIAVARLISQRAPNTKILFVSANHDAAIVQEALRTSASGYVLKSAAGKDLLPAVQAVLEGKRFISARLDHYESNKYP